MKFLTSIIGLYGIQILFWTQNHLWSSGSVLLLHAVRGVSECDFPKTAMTAKVFGSGWQSHVSESPMQIRALLMLVLASSSFISITLFQTTTWRNNHTVLKKMNLPSKLKLNLALKLKKEFLGWRKDKPGEGGLLSLHLHIRMKLAFPLWRVWTAPPWWCLSKHCTWNTEIFIQLFI